jgi:hypothetical protein
MQLLLQQMHVKNTYERNKNPKKRYGHTHYCDENMLNSSKNHKEQIFQHAPVVMTNVHQKHVRKKKKKHTPIIMMGIHQKASKNH